MERYLKIIIVGFSIFPFIALLITIPFIIYNYHKYGSINKLRTIIIYSFILYLLCAYFFVILPLPTISSVASLTTPRVQLVVGQFLIDCFTKSGLVLSNVGTYVGFIKSNYFLQPLFNIFLTLPFGIYLHYYFKCSTIKTVFYSFLLSLFFELTQLSGLYFIYPRGYRLFDVDDLLLNTFGGFIGYYVANLFNKTLPNREKIDEESYKDSKIISGLRRITALSLDIFFVICIISFSLIFGLDNYFTFISIAIIVILEIIYPLIKGYTWGEGIVHIKAISNENKQLNFIIYLILKAFLVFILPFIVFYYGGTVVLILYFGYFIISFIKIVLGHKLFFENNLNIDFVSTLLK